MGTEPNEGQRRVIETLDGDLFVSAGAGSGKTYALAHRFARALTHGSVPMDGLLTITFTEKAASELVERIRRTLTGASRVDLARRVDEAWISTIHGLCSRLLRRHAMEAGVDPRFEVLDAVTTGVMMYQAFEEAVEACRTDDGAEMLLDEYGLTVIRDCVLEAYTRVRAMGRETGDLLPCSKPRFRSQALSAEGHLAALEAEFSTIKQTDTVAENRRRVCEARELLRQPDAEVVFGLRGVTLAKRGAEEAKALAREGDEVLTALVGAAAECLAEPYERAFLAVLAAFSWSYERLKAARGALDFDDLQLRAARLLEQRPDVAARYRDRFRLVMVDEFQDTDELQTRVVRPLVDNDLCTVGDDKQSIYSFRYAEVEVFRSLAAEMGARGAAQARLDINYRSHPGILGFVNAVFGRPPFFDDLMLLRSGRRDGGPDIPGEDPPRVELLIAPSVCDDGQSVRDVEAQAVADRIGGLIEDGVKPGDIVLLLRAKGPIGAYADALRSRSVPVLVAAEAGYFERPEVALGLALVRVLANPRDDEALARLLSGPVGRVRDDVLYLLRRHRSGSSLWDALVSVESSLAPDDAHACRLVAESVRSARAVLGREGLRAGLDALLHRLDVDLALLAGLDGDRAWANVRKIVRLAAEFERTESSDPAAFVDYLSQRESHVRSEPPPATAGEGASAVRIMTQHAAKGLEFPVVVVPDLGRALPTRAPAFLVSKTPEGPRLSVRLPAGEDDRGVRTPSYDQAYGDARRREVEEEKRLLYVACTRAEERLILSGASNPLRPAEDRPIGWLREALEMGAAGGVVAGTVGLGDEARVEVVLVEEPRGVEERVCETDEGVELSMPSYKPDIDTSASESIVPPTVSYSAIAEYRRCPRRYHLSRRLRLASPEIVRKADDPLAFGSAVHAALQVDALGLLDEGRLEALARAHGLDRQGRERLSRAVEVWRSSATNGKVVGLERAGSRLPEVPLAVPVGGTLLIGTLDLLVRDGSRALIVDYKTGVPDAGEDLRRRYETQAECYALAALRSGMEHVEVEFVLLERGGEAVTFGFEQRDAQRLAERVEAVLGDMERGSFPTLDRFDSETCHGCPGLGAACSVRPPVRGGRH